MNTAIARTNGSRTRRTMLGAFFAILAALLFGSMLGPSTASAETPVPGSAPTDGRQPLPEGFLRICKVWEAQGEANEGPSTFKFLVQIDNAAPDGVIDDSFYVDVTVAEGGKACSEPFEVPLGAKVIVTEVLPDGFDSAPGYPKWELSAGFKNSGTGTSLTFDMQTVCLTAPCTIVFYNMEEGPRRIPIRVCKVYLNNEDDDLNAGTIFDFDINGKPFNINAAESESNCKLVWVTVDGLDENITISEHLPGDWNSAPGYPKVEMDNNPFDDNDHGASSNSITFTGERCIEFDKPSRPVAMLLEYACTIIFYNLEDVPGDDCTLIDCDPPICIDNCPEEECEIDCEPTDEECEVDCEPTDEECREDCDQEEEPQCTEDCGEPQCLDCDDTPDTSTVPEPKAPNTGTGMLIEGPTNPTVIAATGVAILMATVLVGMAVMPKRS